MHFRSTLSKSGPNSYIVIIVFIFKKWSINIFYFIFIFFFRDMYDLFTIKWNLNLVVLMQELEEVGGLEELEKEISRRIKISKNSWSVVGHNFELLLEWRKIMRLMKLFCSQSSVTFVGGWGVEIVLKILKEKISYFCKDKKT